MLYSFSAQKHLLLSRLISSVFSCFLFLFVSFGQPDSTTNGSDNLLDNDGGKIINDAAAIFGAPLRFNNADWLTTAAVVGGTVLLFTVDESGRKLALRNNTQFGENLSRIGKEYGREIYGLSAAGGLYLGGLVFKHEGARTTGVMLFESVAMAGVVNMALKTIIGRRRPYTGEGAMSFRGMQFSLDNTSLPSGHSTVAFSVSSVLANRIDNVYASVGLYSLATLTALSRVYNDYHWISDTFLGAAIGTSVGLYVSRDRDELSHARLQLIPFGNGMRIEYRLQ
jgi:membrane-associated phospholipid phosphatase